MPANITPAFYRALEASLAGANRRCQHDGEPLRLTHQARALANDHTSILVQAVPVMVCTVCGEEAEDTDGVTDILVNFLGHAVATDFAFCVAVFPGTSGPISHVDIQLRPPTDE